MSEFDEYAADQLDGMKAGVAGLVRHAWSDVGSKYQEVLMSHASISPPEALTGTMETVTTEADAQPSLDIAPPQLDIAMG